MHVKVHLYCSQKAKVCPYQQVSATLLKSRAEKFWGIITENTDFMANYCPPTCPSLTPELRSNYSFAIYSFKRREHHNFRRLHPPNWVFTPRYCRIRAARSSQSDHKHSFTTRRASRYGRHFKAKDKQGNVVRTYVSVKVFLSGSSSEIPLFFLESFLYACQYKLTTNGKGRIF